MECFPTSSVDEEEAEELEMEEEFVEMLEEEMAEERAEQDKMEEKCGDTSEDEAVEVDPLDTPTMLDQKRFYDRDRDIQTCRNRKMAETSRNECSIGWWYKEEFELGRPARLNSPQYMKELNRMLWEGQDLLNLFKFVCFYYERDMDVWLRESSDELPFGLVSLGVKVGDLPGEFVLEKRASSFKSQLRFNCTNERMSERYDFYIYEEGCTFAPLVEKVEGCDRRSTIAPVSPFLSLYADKKDVVEAKVCMMDANFQATHPEPFLFSKVLPDAGLEEIPTEVSYALDDVDPARQSGNLRRMNVATVAAENYITRMNRKRRRYVDGHSGGASDRAMEEWEAFRDREEEEDEKATLFEERLEVFGRISIKQTLKPLPSSMQISRGPPPTILVRPDELQRPYEDTVCNLMNFPHLFFKPHTSMGGLGKVSLTPSELTFSQRQLEDSISQQQTRFQTIFGELYGRTFGVLDSRLMEEMTPETERIRREITVKMKFRNHIAVSDDSIQGLLPFLAADVVKKSDIRPLLVRKYGFDEKIYKEASEKG
jgi:hypothetical protein